MKRCYVCGSTLGVTQSKKYCSERCTRYKRPFRIWDGEGKTIGERHLFTLLANSDGEYIENENGLTTAECLEFLTRNRPKAYDVWFSFGYDVNKMLEHLPLEGERNSCEELWKNGVTKWHGYRIEYTPRKLFSVSRHQRNTFHSYDTFGFFQKSFLKACKDWGLDPSEIEEGKNSRGDFASWSPQEIRDYNFLEMNLAKELLNRLRDALYDANLLPQSWHGPGAIAAVWLKRERIDEHFGEWPDEMRKPVMHGYVGGRIDIAAIGQINVFKYDIASAYPAALTDCISTANVEWKCTEDAYALNDRHALYHVEWRIPRSDLWGPFPWRNAKGVVLYPYEGEGWYWGVEVLAAERIWGAQVKRIAVWYPQGAKVFPFKNAIERDYTTRAKLKAAGKAANVAIKLALNSLYGKTCQHEAKHGKPRWQNYIWGGYITAHARAKILGAFYLVGIENVVGIATDGLFLRCPLPGAYKIDKKNPLDYTPLGDWEDEGYTTMLIVAPGLYATVKGSDTKVYRSRGLPSQINFGFVLREWGCDTTLNTDGADSTVSTKQTFIGMGRALQTNMPRGTFVNEKRGLQSVALFGTSKRFPSIDDMVKARWLEMRLLPKPRKEQVISFAYKWRPEFDPKEDKE